MPLTRALLTVLIPIAPLWTAAPADGQTPPGAEGAIRPCSAAWCEDITAMVTALDTVLRARSACAHKQLFIASELYWDPFAIDADGGRGQKPSYPAIGRWGDRGRLALRVYAPRISLIDLDQPRRVHRDGCLMVFSPPTWLGPATARVIVAVLGASPEDHVEWYVFLSHDKAFWKVDRVELGRQR